MLKIAVALQWLFFLQFIEDMKRRVVYLWGEWQLLNTDYSEVSPLYI